MINKQNILKIALAGTLLTFSGCEQQPGTAVKPSHIIASDYFAKKDYKKAIEYYQKALNEKPNNQIFKTELTKSKTMYVQSELVKLNSSYSSTSDYSIQNLTSYINKIDTLESYANIEELISFKTVVTTELDNTNNKISSTKQEIDTLLKSKSVDKIDNKIVLLNSLDKSIKQSDYLKELNKKLLDISDYVQTEKLIAQTIDLIELMDLETAFSNIKDIETLNVKDKILVEKTKKVRALLTKKFLAKTQEYFDQHQLSDAYFELEKASYIKSTVKYTQVGKNVLDALYTKAKEFMDMGLIGSSYSLFTYINKINSNYKSVFVLQRDLKDKLIKNNILKLAVSEFVIPNMDKSSGTRFTASLTSQLFKQSLNDLKVIERNRLNIILDELKLRETGNLESLAQRGKIKGLNVFVFGDIIESAVEPQRVETKISKKVQIGTRKINNNQYMMYMMASDLDKDKWPKMPSQFLEEPEYQIISYNKGEIKKTANLIVSVRIVDIERGEIIAAKTIESQEITSDKYNEGVEFAGIMSDPENIASDKTLLNKLYKKMRIDISNFILEPFKNREIVLQEKTNLQMERREYKKAMESLMNSVIIHEIKNEPVDKSIYEKQNTIFKEMTK